MTDATAKLNDRIEILQHVSHGDTEIAFDDIIDHLTGSDPERDGLRFRSAGQEFGFFPLT